MGKPYGHGHHEAHTDHLSHQVGGGNEEHVAPRGLGEAHVAEEAHLQGADSRDTCGEAHLPERPRTFVTSSCSRTKAHQLPDSYKSSLMNRGGSPEGETPTWLLPAWTARHQEKGAACLESEQRHAPQAPRRG